MEIRKLLLSALAAAAAMLLLAGLWHTAIMGPYYAREMPVMQEVVRYDVIGLSYLVLGVLMAIVYPKGYTGGPPAAEGFRFGLVMGLIYSLPHSMVLFAVTGSLSGVLVLTDAAWHMVEQGVGGMVIALVCGPMGRRRLDPEDLDDDALG